ncbi:hypothetical protein [Roseomonas mucosa]|uniref:hypothetical protein n=1 Tax=Roseomonas mucosa TaxID=207340 RepID=UPI002B40E73E|nr:hypothetical protein [Roseomonas mucosa]
MRDGIWKGLPLPREWKAVLRSCTRDSERGQTAQGKLAFALAKALADLSPAFLRRLQARAAEASPGLPGFSDPAALGARSVLEGMIASRFAQLENAGVHGSDLAHRAVEEALSQWRDRMGRQLRQHCFREAGGEAAPVIGALRAAEDATDLAEIAADYLAGKRPGRSAPRPAINLDEDLTGVL